MTDYYDIKEKGARPLLFKGEIMDKNNRAKTFMKLLVGLEAVEFVGLCKFLGVRLIEENYEPAPSTPNNTEEKKPEARDFTDLFSDLLQKFSELSRPRQHELIKILKKVNK